MAHKTVIITLERKITNEGLKSEFREFFVKISPWVARPSIQEGHHLEWKLKTGTRKHWTFRIRPKSKKAWEKVFEGDAPKADYSQALKRSGKMKNNAKVDHKLSYWFEVRFVEGNVQHFINIDPDMQIDP